MSKIAMMVTVAFAGMTFVASALAADSVKGVDDALHKSVVAVDTLSKEGAALKAGATDKKIKMKAMSAEKKVELKGLAAGKKAELKSEVAKEKGAASALKKKAKETASGAKLKADGAVKETASGAKLKADGVVNEAKATRDMVNVVKDVQK